MRLTRLAIATAPAIFVLLWSTGFIGARYGLPYIEPLTFLAVRMGFVVLIMGAIALDRWCESTRRARKSDTRWSPARSSMGCTWVAYLPPSARGSRPAFQHSSLAFSRS